MATIILNPTAGVNTVTNTYAKIHAYVTKFADNETYYGLGHMILQPLAH
jgi:hypothetical protein